MLAVDRVTPMASVRTLLSSAGCAVQLLMMLVMLAHFAETRRYRYCAEGCCLHEYCAYHKICYPKIHCGLGCPDGTCEQGVCMPPAPCNTSTRCGRLGHACLYHYNLGYSTCQYNLDIGRSLCVDRNGRSILKPLS